MTAHRAERPVPLRRARAVTAVLAVVVTVATVLVGTAAFPSTPPSRSTPADASAATGSAGGARGLSVAPRAAPVHRGSPRALPEGSGAGRRVVFAIDRQRVWLVGRSGEVVATYLVSGSRTHNLHPGHYRVYSRSRWAVGVDDSGVMQYFVRFAHGRHAAIGFHSIPTKLGRPLQTRAQLGTPRSHGCIRQALPDAIRLWRFAPVGTRVVVTS